LDREIAWREESEQLKIEIARRDAMLKDLRNAFNQPVSHQPNAKVTELERHLDQLRQQLDVKDHKLQEQQEQIEQLQMQPVDEEQTQTEMEEVDDSEHFF
jgi:uncharacterized membrane protein